MHEHTYCYVGYKACGCAILAVVDVEKRRGETAKIVATAIKEGYTIARLTVEDAKGERWGCDHGQVDLDLQGAKG